MKAFKEFGRLVIKLVKLKNDPGSSGRKVEKLEEEIKNAGVVSKEWLLEQVQALAGEVGE